MMNAALLLTIALQVAPPAQLPQAPAPLPQQTRAADGLALQIALDRAGFSPGVIDGKAGGQTRLALEAYRRAHGGEPPAVEPLATYEITAGDAAGPFSPDIPSDLVDQAKLPHLGYRNLLEALAERFHATPALLQQLNPQARFEAGETITVPNVEPMEVPPAEPAGTKPPDAGASKLPRVAKSEVTVTVSKSTSTLTVTDAGGKVVLHAPVTTGSERDPLPLGKWKVNGVGINPPFRYNPDLFWDASPSDTKAVIPPGPNNPVGLVWVDISKEHYGLHGTPEPSAIGRSQSHGCVRLTNWDALRLASLVKPGTVVIFKP